MFDGVLRFIPRSRTSTGHYISAKMKGTFPAHVEKVIKEYGLEPYKHKLNEEIICCRTRAIPLGNHQPTLTSPKPTKQEDSALKTITICEYRFQQREAKLLALLTELRVAKYKGIIRFVPDLGHYSVNNKWIPDRLIKLCKSRRIHAELDNDNKHVVVANMEKLLPRPKRKKKAQVPVTRNDMPSVPPQVALYQRKEPEPEKEPVQTPFLGEEGAQISFKDFPKRPNIAGKNNSEGELVLTLDIQEYSLPAARDYVWDVLVWASRYPFLTVQFVTGPVVRSPILSNPRMREQVVKVIQALEEGRGTRYVFEIPKQNQSLVTCRVK